MKPRIIDRQVSEGGQCVLFTEVLVMDQTRFKVSIKSDAYSFQSHAKIYRWNGEEWKNVHSLHFNQMKTPFKLAYIPGNKTLPDPFMDDREQLIRVAKQVCCSSS